MTDDLSNTRHEHDERINVNQQDDIDYWINKLKVSEPLLLNAVKAVGPRAEDVKDWLKSHRYLH